MQNQLKQKKERPSDTQILGQHTQTLLNCIHQNKTPALGNLMAVLDLQQQPHGPGEEQMRGGQSLRRRERAPLADGSWGRRNITCILNTQP